MALRQNEIREAFALVVVFYFTFQLEGVVKKKVLGILNIIKFTIQEDFLSFFSKIFFDKKSALKQ